MANLRARVQGQAGAEIQGRTPAQCDVASSNEGTLDSQSGRMSWSDNGTRTSDTPCQFPLRLEMPHRYLNDDVPGDAHIRSGGQSHTVSARRFLVATVSPSSEHPSLPGNPHFSHSHRDAQDLSLPRQSLTLHAKQDQQSTSLPPYTKRTYMERSSRSCSISPKALSLAPERQTQGLNRALQSQALAFNQRKRQAKTALSSDEEGEIHEESSKQSVAHDPYSPSLSNYGVRSPQYTRYSSRYAEENFETKPKAYKLMETTGDTKSLMNGPSTIQRKCTSRYSSVFLSLS